MIADVWAAAEGYAAKDLKVLPLHTVDDAGRCTCGESDCNPGKHPLTRLTRHGVKDASSDPKVLARWRKASPEANIGIATGEVNGIVVLDVDGPLPPCAELWNLPPTPTVITGNGRHMYFKSDGGAKGSGVVKLPGVNKTTLQLKGDNGYVVAPPSRHASGAQYAWAEGLALGEVEPAPMPEGLLHVLRNGSGGQTGAPRGAEAGSIPVGQRNATLTSLAGSMRRVGMSGPGINAGLQVENSSRCDPHPLEPQEVERIANSVSKYQPAPAADNAPVLITGAALRARDFPPVKWAVRGILPAGFSLLCGKPKIGKSYLSLQVAEAVATGGQVLGQDVEPGDALVLALEDSLRRLQGRLEQMLGGCQAPDTVHFSTDWPRLEDGGVEHLENFLRQHRATRIIVVDTLAKVRKEPRANAQIYYGDYKAIEPLKRLADAYEIPILAVHHLRKTEATDPLDEVSGSTGLTGAADTILLLKRTRGTADAELIAVGRDIEDVELAVSFDPVRCLWQLRGPAEVFRQSEQRQAILGALNECEPRGPRVIALALGMPEKTVQKLLGRLVDAGLVEKQGRGLYIKAGCIGGNGVLEGIGGIGCIRPSSNTPIHPIHPAPYPPDGKTFTVDLAAVPRSRNEIFGEKDA